MIHDIVKKVYQHTTGNFAKSLKNLTFLDQANDLRATLYRS